MVTFTERSLLAIGVSLLLVSSLTLAADPPTSSRFTFGAGKAVPGFTAVAVGDTYNKDPGRLWGFEDLPVTKGHAKDVAAKSGDPVAAGYVTSDNRPFYFSVAVPEGNYKVTVTAGSPDGPTDLTVKAELRRLMVEHLHVEAGRTARSSFVVNVRTPAYPGGRVSLKQPRETTDEAWAWDEKLTLEFNGPHPNVCAVEIERVDVPTVFLLGDSTMCDQSKEPWNSWGQMFPRFFQADIAVANHAESGETVASSLAAHRFDKVWSLMKKGDYLIFAYGHNDMKGDNLSSYIQDYHRILQQTKAKGGVPIVVSSVERMSGAAGNTLGSYPDAARQVAGEEHVAFIDLHAKSQIFYQALGKDDLHLAFAFANNKQDGTHHDNYGSYEISALVLQGLRDAKIEDLTKHIQVDVPVFDPARPLKPGDFKMPLSAFYDGVRPPGD